MKKSFYVLAAVLTVVMSFPLNLALAQKSAPQSSITYPGDTNETINRRAKWIEGAKREGMLVWWGTARPEEAKELIAAFNKVYPFIKVVYWRGRGDEVGTKFEAEFTAGRPTVDTCFGGGFEHYPRWAKMGMLAEFSSIIPRIEKFDKRMYGRRGDWFMPGLGPKVPQYNTKLVTAAEAPRNWDDLLDPKWKGQVGGEVEAEDWTVLAVAEGGWGIEKTENFLTRLKEQKPRFIQGGSAAHALLVAGEFKINALGNLRHVLISQKKKASVDWVRVKPVIVFGPSFVLSKKAPHANAARLFLEWQLSPHGLPLWAEVTQNFVPGMATQISRLLEGMPLVVRTEEVSIKIADLDLIKKFNKRFFGIED